MVFKFTSPPATRGTTEKVPNNITLALVGTRAMHNVTYHPVACLPRTYTLIQQFSLEGRGVDPPVVGVLIRMMRWSHDKLVVK
jgi:hypothetical protein